MRKQINLCAKTIRKIELFTTVLPNLMELDFNVPKELEGFISLSFDGFTLEREVNIGDQIHILFKKRMLAVADAIAATTSAAME